MPECLPLTLAHQGCLPRQRMLGEYKKRGPESCPRECFRDLAPLEEGMGLSQIGGGGLGPRVEESSVLVLVGPPWF